MFRDSRDKLRLVYNDAPALKKPLNSLAVTVIVPGIFIVP